MICTPNMVFYKQFQKRCEFETHSGEVYSIQHYVIKFVSDLWQVGGVLWGLWFPPPIKLTLARLAVICINDLHR
jgi:hypothetical protein